MRIFISEKIVQRIMAECGLKVKFKRKIKYNSYRGEITPAGKIHLTPIVNCSDSMLPAWEISTTPDAMLVNNLLDDAVRALGKMEHPLIHTDRGCHYRWTRWISRMETAGLKRSMSRKGCSPDNSACEGLFGRIKNEMFYNRNWNGISIPRFIEILNNYLIWYNEKRIKTSLGNMSPLEYRLNLGLVV